MNKKIKLLLLLVTFFQMSFANRVLVKNMQEFDAAIAAAKPGDVIVMQNGNWQNASMVITCEGTKENPITVLAEKNGEVKLTGTSSLQIGGKYVVIEGLHFTQGYSLQDAVISFRAKGKLANNCRITNCAVIDYNNPKRMDEDYWVNLRGQNNRIDHCSFVDKKNMGVLMAVTLDDDASRKNFHSIDHNYFGRRLPLGNNSGEIIRVGNSQHALFYSNTQITDNLFEECDGEAEVISIKACGNLVKNNVFKKCQGSVVLRHGNDNRVEGNLFLGMGKESTGGVRIINEDQVVVNNLFYQLTGENFRAPLTIMNGVPNSPPIRYVTVRNALIANNSFVECSPLSICEGSDAERTEPPKNVFFINNAFYNPLKELMYTHDKIDSIFFINNAINFPRGTIPNGIITKRFNVQKVDALSFPNTTSGQIPNAAPIQAAFQNRIAMDFSETIGATPVSYFSKILAASKNSGADWLRKQPDMIAMRSVNSKNAAELEQAIKNHKTGNLTINLTGDQYKLQNSMVINGNIVLKQSLKKTVRITSNETLSSFMIKGGSSLKLQGVSFDLADMRSRHFISLDSGGSSNHTSVVCISSGFSNQKQIAGNSSFIHAPKASIADSIVIRNSTFTNNSVHLITGKDENDDRGIYNIEKIRVINNNFAAHKGSLVDLYRGGTDESTLGPDFMFTNNRIMEATAEDALFKLTGIQKTIFSNNKFINSNKGKKLIVYTDRVRAKHIINNNDIINSGTIEPNQFVIQTGNKKQ